MACKQFNQIYRNNNNNSSNLIKFPRSTPPCAHLKRCRCHAPTPAEQLATCLNFFFHNPPALSLSLSLCLFSSSTFFLLFSSAFSHLNASSKQSLALPPFLPHRKLKVETKSNSSNNSWPAAFFFWQCEANWEWIERCRVTPPRWISSFLRSGV